MASRAQDNSRIVSVRLPDELLRRLDRYLDWSETSGRVKSSHNVAIREALRTWLDDHDQLACGLSHIMGSCPLLVIYHSGMSGEAALFYHMCP